MEILFFPFCLFVNVVCFFIDFLLGIGRGRGTTTDFCKHDANGGVKC